MDKRISSIITLFILAIIAVPFMTTIAGITNQQSNLQTVTNESHNISETNVGTLNINDSVKIYVDYDYEKTSNQPISSFSLNNGTATAPESSYDLNASMGYWTINNVNYWQNSGDLAYASYDYKDSSYLESSIGRTLVAILVGFMALVVVVYIVSKLVGSDLWDYQ